MTIMFRDIFQRKTKILVSTTVTNPLISPVALSKCVTLENYFFSKQNFFSFELVSLYNFSLFPDKTI